MVNKKKNVGKVIILISGYDQMNGLVSESGQKSLEKHFLSNILIGLAIKF